MKTRTISLAFALQFSVGCNALNTSTTGGPAGAAIKEPAAIEIVPRFGSASGGDKLRLFGSILTDKIKIKIGVNDCTNVFHEGPDSYSCIIPQSDTYDPQNVVVSLAGVDIATLTNGFRYVHPLTMTSVSPGEGNIAGGNQVNLSGTGFFEGMTVSIGGSPCSGVVITSENDASCAAPSRLTSGTFEVIVTNTDGHSIKLTSAYTYNTSAQAILVHPPSGPTAGGNTLSLVGSGFRSGMKIFVGTNPCGSVNVTSKLTATCVVPAGTVGATSIVVFDSADSTDGSVLTDAFSYNSGPAVTRVTPAGGSTSGGTSVTITGSGFSSDSTVTFGSASCSSVVVVSASQIRCTTPAASEGQVAVNVSSATSGTITLANGYNFTNNPAPTITQVSPSSGSTTGGTAITITGSGFIAGATLTIGGAACTSVTLVSATSLTCTTPSGTVGSTDVSLTNGDAQLVTSTGGFRYTAPAGGGASLAILSVSPTVVPTSGGTAFTITGTGFAAGPSVKIGGVDCTSITFVSSTSITCVVPAGAAGTANVVVQNAGSPTTATLTGGVTYSALATPTISGASPWFGPRAGGTTITLTGTGFVDGGTVQVGTSVCTSPTFISSSSMTCITPPGAFGTNSLTITNTDGQSASLGTGFSYSASMPPSVGSLTPNFGPVAGNSTITIAGGGFLTNPSVTIGGAVCAVLSQTATTITCSTPVGAYGPQHLVITNADGLSTTMSNAYTYSNGYGPTISTLSPNYSGIAGGITVTINGSGFGVGTTVQIGGVTIPANAITTTQTTLTFTVPGGGTWGAKNVVVTNADGQSVTLASGFTYSNGLAPTLTTLSPNYVPLAGGTSVTINGSNFISGAVAFVGGIACASTTFVSSTKLTCVTPPGSLGNKVVTVTNPDTLVATASNSLIYFVGQTLGIATIVPNVAAMTGGTTITITGNNFLSGATVQVGGVTCPTVTVVSSDTITCVTPALYYGSFGVSVSNPDGTGNTWYYLYTNNGIKPYISFLSPNFGAAAGGTSVTITGTGFVAGTIAQVDGIDCASTTFTSSTSLTCVTPPGQIGAKQVTIVTPERQSASFNSFSYNNGFAPTVASVVPNFGPVAGGTTVTINGANFQNDTTVQLGGFTCPTVTYISSTVLTCVTPPGSAGLKALTVINPDIQTGTLNITGTITNGFTYGNGLAPGISSVNPNFGPASGNNTVTILGSNFLAGAAIQIGTVNCSNVTVNSATSISCTAPAGSYGAKQIAIINPDGQTVTLASGYTYSDGLAPNISSISPNFGAVAGGTVITVLGSNFVAGAVVQVGGVTCPSVTWNSATSLSCTTPPGAYSGSTPQIVKVINPDGQVFSTSAANGYNYNSGYVPVLASVQPNFGPVSGGTTITIAGSGFMSGAIVQIGGFTCPTVTWNSATSITCVTPAGTYGAKAVNIVNPDGVSTATSLFTYSAGFAPVVSSVFPTTGPVAGGTAITIIGSAFLNGAVVTIGGIACTSTTYVSPTMLSCVAPAGTIGALAIQVRNPDNQLSGAASTFTYALSATYLYTISGVTDFARLGWAVTGLGDINVDGKPDFAVSEPNATASSTGNAGKVYVYSGASGSLLCTLQSPSPAANGSFGYALASGDINSDGTADLVVGEPGGTAGGLSGAGNVYVFSGTTINTCASPPISSTLHAFSAGSPEAGAAFGYSVATGLINADSNFDLLVGEPYFDNGGTDQGRISTFSGATGTALYSASVNPIAGEDLGVYGFSVATADMNGDGKDDIIVGSPGSASGGVSRGKVFALSGLDGTTQLFTALTDTADNAKFGYSIARAGKVRNSKNMDIVIGEPYWTTGQGRVFVYGWISGGTAAITGTIVSPNVLANSLFGTSVAYAGDVDGDGKGDFMIGQPYWGTLVNGTPNNMGKLYVYSGGLVATTLVTGPIITATGNDAGALLGRSAASAGDINGDGFSDILFGEPFGMNGGPKRGRAYIYLAP